MRLFSRLAASHSLRCSAGNSVSSSLQRSLSTLTVDRWDLVDFRVRALRRLRGEVRETHATLSEHERHRWQQLGSENKLDWTLPETLSGVERVLGGPVHVEKDKHIVRELLKLSVQKAPSHRLVQMFRSVSPDGESTQSQCFQFLMDLGVITPDTNPCVLRHEEPLFFSPQVLAEVPRLQQLDSQHDVDRHIRQDLRSLPALTIDAPNASEIDDAVSVGPDGWIYIHVADPNRLIEPRSLLDRYAARRAVSVFLPEKTFPLLPSKISTEMLSINPGKQTRVLTFGARIADDGKLLEHKVFVALLQNVHKGKCGKVPMCLNADLFFPYF
jgi:exoribonuclease R